MNCIEEILRYDKRRIMRGKKLAKPLESPLKKQKLDTTRLELIFQSISKSKNRSDLVQDMTMFLKSKRTTNL